MHYLITGHTGFKGSWLSLLLSQQGHVVSGIALDPEAGALFERVDLGAALRRDLRVDIRDAQATLDAVREISPDVIVHMAAQPLVRESYRDPRTTFETNVLGTLNVLEAAAHSPSVQAQVFVTTDKVYRNVGQAAGYVETDPLGGTDPYSSSKAMADLLVQSWTASFPGVPTAIARAGNVIGGGDVCAERLMPDLIRGFSAGVPVAIRYPAAVRPWQHVLDCLTGYLALVEGLLGGGVEGAWNFGPEDDGVVTVGEVAQLASSFWGGSALWTEAPGVEMHEAGLLCLDSSRARDALAWRNRLSLAASVEWTVDWAKQVGAGADPLDVTLAQIAIYEELVRGGS